jgi:hypothetical protein
VRVFYYLYGVYCFLLWSVIGWFATLHAFGILAYRDEAYLDDLHEDYIIEEVDKIVGEFYD